MSLLLEKRGKSGQSVLAFFSGIQKRCYVDGLDPGQPAF